jgi:hypothetical protein
MVGTGTVKPWDTVFLRGGTGTHSFPVPRSYGTYGRYGALVPVPGYRNCNLLLMLIQYVNHFFSFAQDKATTAKTKKPPVTKKVSRLKGISKQQGDVSAKQPDSVQNHPDRNLEEQPGMSKQNLSSEKREPAARNRTERSQQRLVAPEKEQVLMKKGGGAASRRGGDSDLKTTENASREEDKKKKEKTSRDNKKANKKDEDGKEKRAKRGDEIKMAAKEHPAKPVFRKSLGRKDILSLLDSGDKHTCSVVYRVYVRRTPSKYCFDKKGIYF